MSKTLARKSCVEFDKAMKQIYQSEYLRLPDKNDLKSICKLHKSVHGIDGMFGSLDCSHAVWKNCPVAWQGSFKGKEEKSTIVLEAISDYQLWFWHAAFGFAGALNDLNILNLSPFLTSLIDGTFAELEKEVTPYEISDELFDQMFVLVDGIYPQYSRFIRGYKHPISEREKKFTEWQEACRKDIERAFGVLQGRWQCMQRPFHQMDLAVLGARVASCLILHNMGVSDRVMGGDVYARYDPAANVGDFSVKVRNPTDLLTTQRLLPDGDMAANGIGNGDQANINMVTKLLNAIMDFTEGMTHPRVQKNNNNNTL